MITEATRTPRRRECAPETFFARYLYDLCIVLKDLSIHMKSSTCFRLQVGGCGRSKNGHKQVEIVRTVQISTLDVQTQRRRSILFDQKHWEAHFQDWSCRDGVGDTLTASSWKNMAKNAVPTPSRRTISVTTMVCRTWYQHSKVSHSSDNSAVG